MRYTDGALSDMLAEPACRFDIQPLLHQPEGCTVDLTLDNQFRKQRTLGQIVDSTVTEDELYYPTVTAASVVMEPGDILLGITKERVVIPDDCVGWLDGRSSLARRGLFIHVTAGRIDPGFEGQIVLEFYNASPNTLRLDAGMRIGALSLEALEAVAQQPYRARDTAKYRGQAGVIGSRTSED